MFDRLETRQKNQPVRQDVDVFDVCPAHVVILTLSLTRSAEAPDWN